MENCNARVPTASENDVLPVERRQSERRAEAREASVTQALAALLDGYRLKKREFPTYSELHGLCVAAPVAAENNPQGLVARPFAAPASQRYALYMAAIDCGHMIEADKIILYRNEKLEGNALSQLADRLAAAQGVEK